MYASTSSGLIELKLTRAQAEQGYHMGACDADIAALRTVPAIRRQLARIDPALLRSELAAWGAWDETELANHDENLSRLLWLMCADIAERQGKNHG